MFPSFRKNKEFQNKFQERLKWAAVSLSKMCRSKIFMMQ